MQERRLLVLGAGPAQLGALAAARRLGLVVIAADRDPSAPGFRYADRRAIVSVEDEAALERLARAERIDGVAAPGADRSLALAARLAAKQGLPHPLAPEVAAVAAVRRRERERLEAAGVPQPRAVLCRTLAEAEAAAGELGYPVVATAADRQGPRLLVEDPSGFGAAVADALAEARGDTCLVEQVPDGPELAVSAFSTEGRFRPLAVACREAGAVHDVPLAATWPAAPSPQLVGRAVELSSAAVAALGVEDGPSTTRVALGPDGPVVVRAAARLGDDHDGELCRVALGVDLNGLAVRAALGDPVSAQELSPAARVGGVCVRFLEAPPGELREVTGLAEAYARPGVRGIRVYRRPGHVFHELRRRSDRAGAILAVGGSRDEARERAAAAARLVRFETVDAPALVR